MPLSSAAQAVVAASSRRDRSRQVTRRRCPSRARLFDQWMVPCFAPAPFIPVRGEGSRVWDQDGGCTSISQAASRSPRSAIVIRRWCRRSKTQARTLWHVSNWFTNEPALRLAKRLTDATFAERVFFCNSGAEANEAALKLARRYAHDRSGPQRARVVSTLNAFHGRTLFTVTAGGQAKYATRLRTQSGRHHAFALQRRRGARSGVRDARPRNLRGDPRADAGRRRHDARHAANTCRRRGAFAPRTARC